jgi:hypothetical protein
MTVNKTAFGGQYALHFGLNLQPYVLLPVIPEGSELFSTS